MQLKTSPHAELREEQGEARGCSQEQQPAGRVGAVCTAAGKLETSRQDAGEASGKGLAPRKWEEGKANPQR